MNPRDRTVRGVLAVGGAVGALVTIAACRTHATTAPNTADTTAARTTGMQRYNWRNVEIVGGGFVTGIVFHPREKDLVYARTDIGGPYRWDAKTRRWVPLLDWLEPKDWNLYGVESLALDPNDPKRVYVAAGTYTNDWAGNGAILRSTDQGRTWQRTDLPFKLGGNMDGRSIGERLAVDPNDRRVLFFGSRDTGLWKSKDQAATWSKVDSFPVAGRTNGIGIGFLLFDPRGGVHGKPTATIYAGVAAPGVNLYRSLDAGTTWQPVPGQTAGMLPHHGVLAGDGMLYLTYGNGPGPNGVTDGAVWKYDTKTGAWANVAPVKPGSEGAGNFGYAGLSVDASHPQSIMVATMDKWSTGDTIFRSTDGGAHWTDLKPKSVRDSTAAPFLNWGRPSADLGHWIGDIEIDPFRPGHVLYVTGATIWGSDDADTADGDKPTHWTVRAQGLEETAVIDLVSPPGGAHLISALGDIGGFRHDDLSVVPRGGIWMNPIISNTDGLDFAERNPAIVARVGRGSRGQNGAISTDGAATWVPFATEPARSQGGGSVAISVDGGTLLWVPRGAAPSLSKDRGATWTACQGLPSGIGRVASDRVNPARFFALDGAAGTVYVSSDGGATFTMAAYGLPKGRDGRLRPTPGREGDLWLTAREGGLYHSMDGGKTFAKVAGVDQANAFGFGKAAPGRDYPALYLIGRIGDAEAMFRSDDVGASWVRIDDPEHRFATRNTITGDPRVYGRVYVGTNGRGILYGDPALGK